ncbi:FMN-linked oxidoreductase [Periconia macrospinosa]|uniref:FMN-linked oxidoreductase n=1 Tax=Periconia macrospinosa TaxID=97972 RepID=A0A2V1EEI1_9PLEO|nr:FMN-linked oxidoreductase [Periconia macrospinosa]
MADTRLAEPLTLPSGLVLRNRLLKSAMAESMAGPKSNPADGHMTVYRTWSEGGWGCVLTGNVDVTTVYMGGPTNIAISSTPDAQTIELWKRWATAAQNQDTPGIVQLVHPGRQSFVATRRGFFEPAIAPSPVPVVTGPGILEGLMSKLLFGTPREMTVAEIETVTQQFAHAAKFVYEVGFKGVEIHGAHGYLLTQFLSPKTNLRTDDYGGTPEKRARIVVEIIRAIRAVVPPSFCVGIKFNSADVGGHESLEESLQQVSLVAAEQIDYINISGGTLENMKMSGHDQPKAERTIQREAFFIDYARKVRNSFPNVILAVTGGFRTRKGMVAALESGACDIIGVGRPATVWPHLPKEIILNDKVPDEQADLSLALVQPPWWIKYLGIKMINFAADTVSSDDELGVG